VVIVYNTAAAAEASLELDVPNAQYNFTLSPTTVWRFLSPFLLWLHHISTFKQLSSTGGGGEKGSNGLGYQAGVDCQASGGSQTATWKYSLGRRDYWGKPAGALRGGTSSTNGEAKMLCR
jgi:hypothetical protein